MLTNADSKFLENPLPASEIDMDLVEQAQGQGFDPEQNIIYNSSLQAATDIWTIDEAIKQLERHGIVVEELRAMHEQAKKGSY